MTRKPFVEFNEGRLQQPEKKIHFYTEDGLRAVVILNELEHPHYDFDVCLQGDKYYALAGFMVLQLLREGRLPNVRSFVREGEFI